MPSPSIRLIVIAIAILAFTSLSFGQGGATGAIAGTVTDPSGAVVANAEKKVKQGNPGDHDNRLD